MGKMKGIIRATVLIGLANLTPGLNTPFINKIVNAGASAKDGFHDS